ncbi:MAG: hypothetical protein WBC73_10965 [Phormidesmis sp.]
MAINNNPSDPNADPNIGGVHGREATPEEIARRDGYVRGRTDENYVQGDIRSQERAVAQARANDSAASGLIFGIIIAILAAGVGAAFYFLSGDRSDVAPVAVPQIEKETITEKETTIIQKEESAAPPVSLPDVQVEVPEVDVPDVNITNEAPAEPEAPAEAAPKAEPEASEPVAPAATN